jgi:CRISPR system Cascade subunit CasB
MTAEPDITLHPFVTYLEGMSEDRAVLAELRRGLGRAPGEAVGMFPYIVPFIRSAYDEADHYLIASLFALHPVSTQRGNMGDHLYAYTQEVGDDAATTRRFTQLLRQRRDSLDPLLRQHISLLKSRDIAVNWHQLMWDLRWWDEAARRVQKRWASAYWKVQPGKSKK